MACRSALCLGEVRERVLKQEDREPNRRKCRQTSLSLHTWTKCPCEEGAMTTACWCPSLGFQIHSICSKCLNEENCRHQHRTMKNTEHKKKKNAFFLKKKKFCMLEEITPRVSQIRHVPHSWPISLIEFSGFLNMREVHRTFIFTTLYLNVACF